MSICVQDPITTKADLSHTILQLWLGGRLWRWFMLTHLDTGVWPATLCTSEWNIREKSCLNQIDNKHVYWQPKVQCVICYPVSLSPPPTRLPFRSQGEETYCLRFALQPWHGMSRYTHVAGHSCSVLKIICVEDVIVCVQINLFKVVVVMVELSQQQQTTLHSK